MSDIFSYLMNFLPQLNQLFDFNIVIASCMLSSVLGMVIWVFIGRRK